MYFVISYHNAQHYYPHMLYNIYRATVIIFNHNIMLSTLWPSLQTHFSQLSPLHIASRNNLVDIARVLLQAGAKLDLKDNDGKVGIIHVQSKENCQTKNVLKVGTLRHRTLYYQVRVRTTHPKVILDTVHSCLQVPTQGDRGVSIG